MLGVNRKLPSLVRVGREVSCLQVRPDSLDDLASHHPGRVQSERMRRLIVELWEVLLDDPLPLGDEQPRIVCVDDVALMECPDVSTMSPNGQIQAIVAVDDEQLSAWPEHTMRLNEELLVVEVVRYRLDCQDEVETRIPEGHLCR